METDQYLDVFLDESREHLQAINDGLLALEAQPDDLSVVQEIFRGAHTLKGMSATMGFSDMAELTHKLENVLDAVRNEELAVSSEGIDILLRGADELEAMTDDIEEGGDGKREISSVVTGLKKLLNEEEAASETALEAQSSMMLNQYEKAVLEQSREQGYSAFRIRVVLREDCLLKAARAFMVFEVLENAGEIIQSVPAVEKLEEEAFDHDFSVILVSQEPQKELKERILKVSEIQQVEIGEVSDDEKAAPPQEQKQKEETKKSGGKRPARRQASKTIRVNIERLDRLMNLFEEFVIDKGRLERISRETNHSELTEMVERMSRISSDMQEMILTLRMVPIEQVFGRFPKMVRDLARDLNKNVQLRMSGTETELDRTVVDEIGDPLVHLLRNSLDHGIESPELRESNGKPKVGTVDLRAYYSGNHVLIEIQDDGAGINREGVLKKALENRVVTETEAERLSDQEVYELLFSSGFSTAETISDISGRGVGLDVVKNKIESLGGRVEVDSEPGKGTTFMIQLPLSLSIIASMLIEAGSETYAIPLSSIVEIAVIRREDVQTAHNQKMIDFRGKMVPLISLRDVFEIPGGDSDARFYSVVIIRKGDKLAGLVVDAFIGHQEIVLKPLGNYFNEIFGVSGATILGDGKVALIIDCNTLIH
ncbi:MAG TPA: chemotaxis protein CheA [Bacillales bacterium]|nr:chemotaxis protein CheA [Bacillales bacterium]